MLAGPMAIEAWKCVPLVISIAGMKGITGISASNLVTVGCALAEVLSGGTTGVKRRKFNV